MSKAKLLWEEKYKAVCQQFPSVVKLEWAYALRDYWTLGRLLQDLIKDMLEHQNRGPGPRPNVDAKTGYQLLQQLFGNDYTGLPFPEAFAVLSAGRSIRHLARKTGMNNTHVYKLLNKQKEPTLFDMEVIAKAFNKRPEYFAEYRMGYLLGVLAHHMENNPDMTMTLYKKVIRGPRN